MFMNLGPLAKALHGVNWRSPQSAGRSQKAEIISSLDTASDAYNRGNQDALPSEHKAHPQQAAVWLQCVYLERE